MKLGDWTRKQPYTRGADAMLLDQILNGLEISVEAFAICEVRHESSLVMQDERSVSVHYVLSGSGVARSLIGPAIPLYPHKVIVAPPGSCIVVSCGESRQMTLPTPSCRALPGGWDWATVGDGGPGLLLACGAVRATHRHAVGLFDYLRTPLVESVEAEPAFREPFDRLLSELADPQPGSKLLAQLLMKQCLIVLLRRQCDGGEVRVPWLAALENPALGKAIVAMMGRPGRIRQPQPLLPCLQGLCRSRCGRLPDPGQDRGNRRPAEDRTDRNPQAAMAPWRRA